jgi:predicted solute-binding protein
VANRDIDEEFRNEFNSALRLGVENIEKVAEYYGNTGKITREELLKYLKVNIDYHLNDEKRKAMELFLDLTKKL